MLEFSKLEGSLVGESVKNLAEALAIANAINSGVLWIDELCDAVGDSESSAKTGSTTGKMVGILSTWMEEEQPPGIIMVATANNFKNIPTKIVRRFDEVFFVDLPSSFERCEIAKVHLELNDSPTTDKICKFVSDLSDGWNGDEIRKLVVSTARRAKGVINTDTLLEAAQFIKPISVTKGDEIRAMREWGTTSVRVANTPEVKKKDTRKIGKIKLEEN